MLIFKENYTKVPLLSKCFSAHVLEMIILQ